jgi:hypothetical protein
MADCISKCAHVPVTGGIPNINSIREWHSDRNIVLSDKRDSFKLLLNDFLDFFSAQFFSCHMNLGWK